MADPKRARARVRPSASTSPGVMVVSWTRSRPPQSTTRAPTFDTRSPSASPKPSQSGMPTARSTRPSPLRSYGATLPLGSAAVAGGLTGPASAAHTAAAASTVTVVVAVVPMSSPGVSSARSTVAPLMITSHQAAAGLHRTRTVANP